MKKITLTAAAAALAVIAGMMTVTADDLPAFDSASDPLISLSYINKLTADYDKKLDDYAALLDLYDQKLTAAADKIASLETSLAACQKELAGIRSENDSLKDKLSEQAGSEYTVICLKAGQKLLAKSPCELILRSGTAIAITIVENGINDTTNGTELLNADAIPLYHALLVPRGNDGRGIQVTSEEAYLMVRGAYEIVG